MKRMIVLTIALALITGSSLPLSARPQDRGGKPADLSKVLASVKSKIELSAEQETAISKLFRDYRKARKEILAKYDSDGDKDREQLHQAIGRLNRDAHGKVETILDLSQMEKFREIAGESMRERRESERSERTDELIALLGVTGGDQERVRSILDGQMEKMRSLMEERRGGGRKGMDGMRGKMEQIGLETEEQLEDVLSLEQMDIYRKYVEEQRERMRGRRPRPERRR